MSQRGIGDIAEDTAQAIKVVEEVREASSQLNPLERLVLIGHNLMAQSACPDLDSLVEGHEAVAIAIE